MGLTHPRPICRDAVLDQRIDDARDGVSRELLIPQRVEDRESELIAGGYARRLNHRHHVLHRDISAHRRANTENRDAP